MKIRIAVASDWSGLRRPNVRGVYDDGSSATGGTIWCVNISSLEHLYDILADAIADPVNQGVMIVSSESVFPDDDNHTPLTAVLLDDMEELCWIC